LVRSSIFAPTRVPPPGSLEKRTDDVFGEQF
jgi:hypothetical protein